MDSLLFLIKKHNNNKTVRYNDKLLFQCLEKVISFKIIIIKKYCNII